jgi:hypothetical protein
MDQERYLRNMPQTIKYINERISEGLFEYVCIPWCGLIVYQHNDSEVRNFADEIYNDIMRWQMPNDQIVWAMVSQKYLNIIQMVGAGEIPVKWASPEDLHKRNKYSVIKKYLSVIKIFMPYGIVRLWQIIKMNK